MLFSQVVGQLELKKKLRNSVKNGRVAHAQMLVGPAGVGSLAVALAFAQYLACKQRTETDACGTCDSCLRYAKLEHPDLQLIFPKNKTSKAEHKKFSSKDFLPEWRAAVLANPYLNFNDWLKQLGIANKQGTINVDDSREVLQNLSYKAYESDYRVVLIWLAEYMNPSAANKLLKILEEPPARTVFIMVAESTENILQTIISRVQIHRLGPLKETEIVAALANENQDANEVKKFAYMANGDLNLAQNLIQDQTAIIYSINFFINWMRACYGNRMEVIHKLAEEFNTLGREQQKALLIHSMSILRKTLMYKTIPNTESTLLNEELNFIHKFSAFMAIDNTAKMLEELNAAHYHLERNAHARITFTDLSFKLGDLVMREAIK